MRRELQMGLAVIALAGLVSACTSDDGAPARSSAQAEEAEVTEGGITVEAVGTVEGTPDVLTARVGVEVRAADVQTAYAEGNEAAAAVRDALVDNGVEADDVQTAQMSLGPRHHGGPDEDTEQEYVARTSLRADLRDLDRAGETIDAAIAAGGEAATLRSLGFSLDDDSDLVVDARDAAFAEAQRKAEQYADLADRSLGDLVGLAEADDPHRPIPSAAGQELALEADSSAAIEPGEEEVEVRVRATWSLD